MRLRRRRIVQVVIIVAAAALLFVGCKHQNLILVLIAIIVMSVIDMIRGNIWWLGEDWDEDPNSETARLVAIVTLVIASALLVLAIAVRLS
jgi:hypothetical protein